MAASDAQRAELQAKWGAIRLQLEFKAQTRHHHEGITREEKGAPHEPGNTNILDGGQGR